MRAQNVFDDLQIPAIPQSYNESGAFISSTLLPANSLNINGSNIDEVEEMALLLAYYSKSTPHTGNQTMPIQYKKKAATTSCSCVSDLPPPTRFRRGKRKEEAEIFACK